MWTSVRADSGCLGVNRPLDAVPCFPLALSGWFSTGDVKSAHDQASFPPRVGFDRRNAGVGRQGVPRAVSGCRGDQALLADGSVGRPSRPGDRKSVVLGKSVYVRVDLGGSRSIKTKIESTTYLVKIY